MTNKYISHGVRQDVENDQNICLTLRTKIIDAINEAEKLKKAGALAYNDQTFDEYIFELDMILRNVITPLEQQLTEGEEHHGYEGNGTQAVSPSSPDARSITTQDG